jgi:hypothetical protein
MWKEEIEELYSDEFISRRNGYGLHRIPWIMMKAKDML